MILNRKKGTITTKSTYKKAKLKKKNTHKKHKNKN